MYPSIEPELVTRSAQRSSEVAAVLEGTHCAERVVCVTIGEPIASLVMRVAATVGEDEHAGYARA